MKTVTNVNSTDVISAVIAAIGGTSYESRMKTDVMRRVFSEMFNATNNSQREFGQTFMKMKHLTPFKYTTTVSDVKSATYRHFLASSLVELYGDNFVGKSRVTVSEFIGCMVKTRAENRADRDLHVTIGTMLSVFYTWFVVNHQVDVDALIELQTKWITTLVKDIVDAGNIPVVLDYDGVLYVGNNTVNFSRSVQLHFDSGLSAVITERGQLTTFRGKPTFCNTIRLCEGDKRWNSLIDGAFWKQELGF